MDLTEKKLAIPSGHLAQNTGAADYSLIIDRIEKSLIHGGEEAYCAQTLQRQSLWENLDKARMLKWADLAQMAGQFDVCMAVYNHLHVVDPQDQDIWERHLELVLILNRREQAAKIIARAEAYLSADWLRDWRKRCAYEPGVDIDGSEIDAAAVPFAEMREKQARLERFMALFSGKEDAFARQWADKENDRQGYVPVRRTMTQEDVSDHLEGKLTYGIYLLDANGMSGIAAIDADLKSEFRRGKLSKDDVHRVKREQAYMIRRIKETGRDAGGVFPLIEFSGGKGFHFWFFFENRVPAVQARAFAKSIVDRVSPDMQVFSLEAFPKQDRLTGKGFGNLVKLPLGIHRISKKRSLFIECPDRRMDAQLSFLKTVKQIREDSLAKAGRKSTEEKIAVHPRYKKWAETYPELYKLETSCPPLGQIISACRERQSLTAREEKILYQVVGFLPRCKTLLHYLAAFDPEYNPHQVDFQISKMRGSPLGCRRIHSLLDYAGDYCGFGRQGAYRHPLLHLDQFNENDRADNCVASRNLSEALEHMREAINRVERFLPKQKE